MFGLGTDTWILILGAFVPWLALALAFVLVMLAREKAAIGDPSVEEPKTRSAPDPAGSSPNPGERR